MQINKISSIKTIARVARELGQDKQWLNKLAIEMEPEHGLI